MASFSGYFSAISSNISGIVFPIRGFSEAMKA